MRAAILRVDLPCGPSLLTRRRCSAPLSSHTLGVRRRHAHAPPSGGSKQVSAGPGTADPGRMLPGRAHRRSRNSGESCSRTADRNAPMVSPLRTVVCRRWPVPSQYEYVTFSASFLSSCARAVTAFTP